MKINSGPNMPENIMHIVFAVDNIYSQHLAVAIASILKNNRGNKLEFHVICDVVSDDNKQRLFETVNKFKASIKFVQADAAIFHDFHISQWITRAAYLRVLIPELISREIEKVLYLDCDLVVENNLSGLWDIDINDYYLAAVRDTILTDRLSVLIGKKGMPYFNSGVMLLNLRKWRDDNITGALLKFISENGNKLMYWEQDALNAVLHDKWLPMHPKWNVVTPMFSEEIRSAYADKDRLMNALKMPHTIHYTGREKPWRCFCRHPQRDKYYKYLELTPWSGFKPRLVKSDIIDGLKLAAKKISPSLFTALKRRVIVSAINGSGACRYICKKMQIELNMDI